jgi:hypothetical protein
MSTTTTTTKQQEEEKRSRKSLIAFAALFASVAIVVGSAFG